MRPKRVRTHGMTDEKTVHQEHCDWGVLHDILGANAQAGGGVSP